MYNEITLLLCTYCCFLFTDFVGNLTTKEQIGWLFIGIVLTNLGLNIALIAGNIILTVV
jgi:hypothetical protein